MLQTVTDTSSPLLWLDEQQDAAARAPIGPTLVIAGPGSGKTRVIIARIVHLIDNLGIDPRSVLVITFTNRAARELSRRLTTALGEQVADQISSSTIHSWGARFLRRYADSVNRRSNFSIYDRDDSMAVINRLLNQNQTTQGEPSRDAAISAASALQYISDCKHRRFEPARDDPASHDSAGENGNPASRSSLYHAYQAALTEANALDFDDLMEYPLQVLEHNPTALTNTHARHHHLLVDEYQDTNRSQHLLATYIAGAGEHASIFVVGDPDQSIYRFRYADINNILDFQDTYPSAGLYRLENNYRSSPEIVATAQAVIATNTQRIERDSRTNQPPGPLVEFLAAENPRREAAEIAGLIRRETESGAASPDDFCIAYRTNAQSWVIEDALREQGLPYRVTGGFEFFRRREIKLYLDYLRLADNPLDEAAMQRVINVPPRSIGDQTRELLQLATMEHDVSLNSLVHRLGEQDPRTEQLSGELTKKARESLQRLATQLNQLRGLAAHAPLPQLLNYISESVGVAAHVLGLRDGAQRWSNVEELRNIASYAAQENLDVTEFLARATMSASSGNPEERVLPHITLTTLHQTKGLEFPQVFIAGVENGLIPHQRATSDYDIEEERRLLYVGITRAQERLVLSACRKRPGERRGNGVCHPSSFLWDIPDELWLEPPW